MYRIIGTSTRTVQYCNTVQYCSDFIVSLYVSDLFNITISTSTSTRSDSGTAVQVQYEYRTFFLQHRTVR